MTVGVVSIAFFSRRSAAVGLPERLLVGGLSLLPGFVLGLSLLPVSSGAGLAALIGIFATLLGASVGLHEVVERGLSTLAQPPLPASQAEPREVLWPDSRSTVVEAASSRSTHPIVEPLSTDDIEPDVAESSFTDELISHPSTDPDVIQWQTRTVRAGQETLEGGMRVRFAAGAKQVALHLPFAPAFESLPIFDAEPLDDADVEVVVTSLHTYGVRLEVRSKSRCEQDRLIEIGYSAVPTDEQSAAA